MEASEIELWLMLAPYEESRGALEEFYALRPEMPGSSSVSFEPSGWSSDHRQLSVVGITGSANRLTVLQVLAVLGPVVGTALGAWLQSRVGRKVRLKVGPDGFEAEAQTREELEKLLEMAKDIQQRNQPKVIHEP